MWPDENKVQTRRKIIEGSWSAGEIRTLCHELDHLKVKQGRIWEGTNGRTRSSQRNCKRHVREGNSAEGWLCNLEGQTLYQPRCCHHFLLLLCQGTDIS
jgi:hypothetical protein